MCSYIFVLGSTNSLALSGYCDSATLIAWTPVALLMGIASLWAQGWSPGAPGNKGQLLIPCAMLNTLPSMRLPTRWSSCESYLKGYTSSHLNLHNSSATMMLHPTSWKTTSGTFTPNTPESPHSALLPHPHPAHPCPHCVVVLVSHVVVLAACHVVVLLLCGCGPPCHCCHVVILVAAWLSSLPSLLCDLLTFEGLGLL
jgi:hypothetical protein